MSRLLLLLFTFPFIANSQITTYNAGQAFTCITVDSNYNIWAGTSKAGLYLLNKKDNPTAKQFTIASSGSLSTYNIQTLAADQYKQVWVGHNGNGGSNAGGGGIERVDINNSSTIKHYSPDRNAECFPSFFARDGLATLNSASIAVDKNGTVWSAHKYHDLFVEGTLPDIILGIPTGGSPAHYIVTPGALSYKSVAQQSFISKGTYESYKIGADPELAYPAYTCDAPISKTPGSRNTYAVACGNNEVWLSVASYEAKNGVSYQSRLLKYDLAGTFLKSYDFASIGVPVGGIFNSIWLTPKGDVWTSMSAGKGFAVQRKGNWMYVNIKNLPCIFPAGTFINPNAIWGNKLGQVFLGTNNGLIVYRGSGPVNSVKSYTRYTAKDNNLISDNIISGASEKESMQWIVTDKGIMSSTLGLNYPLSVDDIDYTYCQNPKVNAIEDQSKMNLSNRIDYHQYTIETQVCSQEGKNGKNCNAEYVYKLMKNNASLTVPTPFDYPYDNLPTLLLLTASKEDLNQIVAKVNAWESSVGGIKNITDVLSPAQYTKFYKNSNGEGKFPFEFLFTSAISRELLAEQQKKQNPETVIQCATYHLYNSPNFIFDRTQLKNWTPCGSLLTSASYDQVWIFPDDKNLTITNYTQPGHFLSPGKVFRSVVEECGKVKIVTTGTGLSDCNALQGSMNSTGNVVAGSILFKNIDIRLKKDFENH